MTATACQMMSQSTHLSMSSDRGTMLLNSTQQSTPTPFPTNTAVTIMATSNSVNDTEMLTPITTSEASTLIITESDMPEPTVTVTGTIGSGDGPMTPEGSMSTNFATNSTTAQAITPTQSAFVNFTQPNVSATSSMMTSSTPDDRSTTTEGKIPATTVPPAKKDTTGLVAAVATACVVLVILIVILCGLICCYHMFK